MDFFKFKNAEKIEYIVTISKITDESFEGYCQSPDYNSPVVRLSKDLMKHNRARRQLAVAIEEMVHAHSFDLTEKVVRKCSTNTARLLYKLGWRQVKEPDGELVVSKRNEKTEIKKTNRKRSKRKRKNPTAKKTSRKKRGSTR